MKITTICFFFQDNGVYLSEKKRGFGKGYLTGYGGKASEGETVEDSAIREIKEEAGTIIHRNDLDRVAIIDFFEADEYLFECHVFFIKRWDGDFQESEEMAFPDIYKLSEIPYDRMWKSDIHWMPLIFSGKRIRAVARYKKGMQDTDSFEYYPL